MNGRTATPLNSQQKLTQSRERLLDAMGYVPMVSNVSGQPMLGRKMPTQPPAPPPTLAALPARVRDSVAAQWVRRWWVNHPIHEVAEAGRPYLQDYARRHPARLMAYSAGAGAVLLLAKPWRFLPVAALLSLTLKSGGKAMVRAALKPDRR